MGATIYYDGQCPFCTQYTSLVELRQAVGDVSLVDLREDPQARTRLESEGFVLDDGMVLELPEGRYSGADAMHRIALIGTHNGLLNRLNSVLFSHPAIARALYPLLRAGRNLTLFALGRSRIRTPPEAECSTFAIFAHAFGVYAYIDLLYHIYREALSLPVVIAGFLGSWLAMRPRSPRLFVALASFLAINGIMQMPSHSNHAYLLNTVLLAMTLAGGYIWLRGRDWSAFMRSFSPVGRALLLVMYVFGVFHKVNTGFLNPETSCAMALWERMPHPLPMLDAPWFQYTAIYGTLVGEALIFIGLLMHRTRYLAIIAGIGFHSILALSGYGYYPAFSTLTITLHLLFLSPEAAQRITRAPEWRAMQRHAHSAPGMFAIAGWMLLLLFFTWLHNSSYVGLLWLPWSLWLMTLVATQGKERSGEATIGPPAYSRMWALNAITIAFFISCAAPYLGWKNSQSMNMFANLVHDAGESNHLVMRQIPRPLNYLDDVVEIRSASGSDFLARMAKGHYRLPYHSLLDHLSRHPNARVDFIRGGQTHIAQRAADLQHDIDRLPPKWARSVFHSMPSGRPGPQYCKLD